MWLDNHMRHMTTSLTNVRHSLEFVVVWSNTPSSCSSGIVTHRAWLCRTAVTWQGAKAINVREHTSTRDSHWVGRGCVALCSYPRVWSARMALCALCDKCKPTIVIICDINRRIVVDNVAWLEARYNYYLYFMYIVIRYWLEVNFVKYLYIKCSFSLKMVQGP